MGKVILCSGAIAQQPYWLEELNINVWSLEELAYVMIQNAILWDQSIVPNKLIDWIRVDCEVADFRKDFKTKEQFILSLVDYLGYYSEEEKEQLKEKLEIGNNVPKIVRKKMRADLLVVQNQEDAAVVEYSKLLKQVDAADVMMKSQILHNQGVAYCRMFQFLAGAKSFFEGYTTYPSVDSFEQYLLALRLHMSETEYINYIDKQGIEITSTLELEQALKQAMSILEESGEKASIEKLVQLHEEMELTRYLEGAAEAIEELKKAYRG